MFDARSVANLILRVAEERRKPVTNLALQKLIYFAHGLYLMRFNKPLVKGYFEAWEYGPVHPVAYASFKEFGNKAITKRAKGRDLLNSSEFEVSEPDDEDARDVVEQVMLSFGRLSAGRLVDVSHAKDGPWDYVVRKASRSFVLGLRITDEDIRARFKNHKISVGDVPTVGDDLDDAPFARH